jgi:predicted Fe-Mo cluster-binding NifX family protein
MKIAVITDDQKTISQHFGRAPYYLVLTVEDGKVTNRELRNKLGHQHFAGEQHSEQEHNHGGGHGMDAASHNRHVSMAEAISDCQVLLCGGMGMGAYQSMQAQNIRPVVTDIRIIDEAVQAYIDGQLQDRVDLLH